MPFRVPFGVPARPRARGRTALAGLASIVLVCVAAGAARAISNLPQTTSTSIVVDGAVNSIAATGSTVLIGGAFTHAGAYTGGFASAPVAGGTLASLPPVNGTVNALVPDASGGWYVGGSFSSVGTTSVTNLAHITASGSVDGAWNPAPDNAVNALAISSDHATLYVGGAFATIGGTTRNDIAALTASTGSPTAWNPNGDGAVTDLVLSPDGSTLYAAGSFANVGGAARAGLAALATATGVASSWNPGPDAVVSALAVSPDGATVYAGGSFANIGGATRSNLAALSASTGLATSWTPQPNGAVSALAVSSSGATVYAGGTFGTVGGQARSDLAALSASTGNATSWDPGPSGSVSSLALSTDGATVYVGGTFTAIGGQSRDNVAAIAASDGTATSWQEDANTTVSVLAATSSAVGIGGAISGVGLQSRSEVAVFSTTSGLLSANPGASGGVVNAVALSSDGATAYVGGAFTTLGGQTRNRIGAFSLTTGLVTSWNPNANNTVLALAASPDGTVYAGGTFTTIAGAGRTRIVQLDQTGAATAWDPSSGVTGQVDAITLAISSGTVQTVYAGGSFTTLAGQGRNRIAAIDPSTGSATAWNPNATSGQVNAIALSPSLSTVYAGGTFTTIGGQARSRIAALSASTGAADATWNPNASSTVNALAVSSDGSIVYAAGAFATIGGQTRNRLASVSSSGTGSATTWNPNASGGVTAGDAISIASSGLVAGGVWTNLGSAPVADLGLFAFDVPVATTSPPVTGTPTVGSTLSCGQGVWANGPTSYAYAWLRDGSAIGGATATTYQLVSADLGHSVSCKVTATNAEGSGTATSSAQKVVAAPSNSAAPVVLGTTQAGSLLTCSPGTWSYSPQFAYVWLRDGAAISGATNATYTAAAGDAGHTIACRVTGTNAAGSAQATSAAVAITAAAGSGGSGSGGTTTEGEASVSAQVSAVAGSLSVPSLATVSWGASTFPAAGTLTAQRKSLSANVNGFSSTSPLLSIAYAAAGSTSTTPAFLQSPLTIVFAAAKANRTAYVAYSDDGGKTWVPVPKLASAKLPAGQLDGYVLKTNDQIVVYTHHTALYGLLKDVQAPTAPKTIVATLGGQTLHLRWPPSADNSRRIRSYQMLRGTKVVATLKGSLASGSVSLAAVAATSLFRVRAVDWAGNAGKPSPAVKVVVAPRPKAVPKKIPAWALELHAWQAKPAAKRGPRPAAPSPLPAWYAAWTRWLATRFRLLP